MLFSRIFRKVDPNCVYCRHGTRISEREVVCIKRGVAPVEHHCRSFRYDPLKRVPPRPAVLRTGGLTEADFSLYDEDTVPGQESLFAKPEPPEPGTPEREEQAAENAAEADSLSHADGPDESEGPEKTDAETEGAAEADGDETEPDDSAASPESGETDSASPQDSAEDGSDEPSSDENSSGDPSSGENTSGDPPSGENTSGDPSSGENTSGDPSSGESSSGDPSSGENSSGTRKPAPPRKVWTTSGNPPAVRARIKAVKARKGP